MTETPPPTPQTPESKPAAPVPVSAPAPRSHLPAWLALGVSLVALTAVILPHYITYAPSKFEQDIRGQIEALKTQTPSAPAAVVDLQPLLDRLAALEQKPSSAVADEPARQTLTELQEKFAALNAKLGQLEQQQNARTSMADRQAGLAISLQLLAAWQQGQPFAAYWQALVASSTQDAELSKLLEDAAPTLAPYQEKGVPTLLKLAGDFPAAARAELAASAPEGQNFGEKVLRKVQGLVIIRKQGETLVAQDTGLDAQLQKAEAALGQGDLATALAALSAPTQSAELKEWLTRAVARAQVEALAQQLVASAGKTLAAEAPAADKDAP